MNANRLNLETVQVAFETSFVSYALLHAHKATFESVSKASTARIRLLTVNDNTGSSNVVAGRAREEDHSSR